MHTLPVDWYRSGWHGTGSIADAVRDGARRSPGSRVHFVSADRPSMQTIGELYERGMRVAAGLVALGVGRGDAVLCQLPNWAETAILLRAVTSLGGVFVPLVIGASPDEVVSAVLRSRAKVVVTATAWRGRDRTECLSALAGSPIEHLVIVGDDSPAGTTPWSELEHAEPQVITYPMPIDTDATAFLLFTSGSTGTPKGVRHSNNTLLSEARGGPIARPGRPPPDETLMQVLPPGHVAELLVAVRTAIFGLPTVVMDEWDPELAARSIERYRVTSTTLVPYHLKQMLEVGQRYDTSTIRGLMVGAAGVPSTLIEEAARLDVPAFRCYGCSEHPTVVASDPRAPLTDRAHTDGPPLPGNQIRIVDESLCDVATGEAGEVMTRGPERALGYLDAEHDEAFLPGGWFRTGDVGRVDQGGRLTITDRLKDIIIRGGENISAKEVEDALVTHPDICEVAVVNVSDARMGERACAFVVTAPGRVVDLPSIAEYLAHIGLARHKSPEQLVVVSELPRTDAGKVVKVALREMAHTERART